MPVLRKWGRVNNRLVRRADEGTEWKRVDAFHKEVRTHSWLVWSTTPAEVVCREEFGGYVPDDWRVEEVACVHPKGYCLPDDLSTESYWAVTELPEHPICDANCVKDLKGNEEYLHHGGCVFCDEECRSRFTGVTFDEQAETEAWVAQIARANASIVFLLAHESDEEEDEESDEDPADEDPTEEEETEGWKKVWTDISAILSAVERGEMTAAEGAEAYQKMLPTAR